MTARRLAALLGVVLFLAGPAQAADPVDVSVGLTNSATDVGFFIADKRGYFAEEGIRAKFIQFDSAARMNALFGSGDLDVGAGGMSAGLYNAIARGIDIRIVADKNSTPPGRSSQKLVMRKDLVDSGRYRTLADLKGMRIATSAPGTAAMGTLVKILEKGGLKRSDVEEVHMSFSQMVLALRNKAVDAALPAEPQATQAIEAGGVRIVSDDEVYPNHQISAVLYSGAFAKRNPALAQGFLRAYLRGVRDHNDSLVDGKFTGPKGDAVVEILTQYSLVKDPAVHRSFILSAINPDGTLDVASMKQDLRLFREAGLVQGKVDVEQGVDLTFLDAVLKSLGPYKHAH
ncbi:MAG: ABC transporter substrate-binding protein [Beijerinckiaceae bacterium]|jgi:NitT/TauT family transport system substrate-binding protein|nr:ABC transporter substrate-binding protein [Beijerinckiaceae bacterium]